MVCRVVRSCDNEDMFIVAYSDSCMPYVGLSEYSIYQITVDEVLFFDQTHSDPLHHCCGHVSKSMAHCHMQFTGSGLSWVRSVSRCMSKPYARAKITRRLFHPTDPEAPQVDRFVEKVTADIAI